MTALDGQWLRGLAAITQVEEVARVRRQLGVDAAAEEVITRLAAQVGVALAGESSPSRRDRNGRDADVLRVAIKGGGMAARLRSSWPQGGPLWVWHRVHEGWLAGPHPVVGIVGTRRPTADGIATAEALAAGLAAAGVEVVSGFARGIDQAAHRGALAAGGITTAVLGTGLDVDYPGGSRALRAQVIASGGLISEHPHGVGVRHPSQFLARNRILAGLCDAIVVIEAGRRSGALNTASWAADLGREVMVIPCSPSTPEGAGSLGLLRDGAACVRDAADVLEAVGVGHVTAQVPAAGPGTSSLSPAATDLLALLGPVPASPTHLAQICGLSPSDLLTSLGELTASGLAARRAGGVVRRT